MIEMLLTLFEGQEWSSHLNIFKSLAGALNLLSESTPVLCSIENNWALAAGNRISIFVNIMSSYHLFLQVHTLQSVIYSNNNVSSRLFYCAAVLNANVHMLMISKLNISR